ncbi:MAG: hypothetical protein LKM34_07910 [Prevotella sp.]|jgi:hypothetical protein|nr:hypothetical protein [Prevotella sp.]
MKNIRFILSLFLLCVCTIVSASVEDTITAINEHNSIFSDVLALQKNNPALMNNAYDKQYSEIRLYTDYEKLNRPILYELGDGHNYAGIDINSYIKLNNSTTVWGSASYRSGNKKDIKWNSTADFSALYPYVMGDTLGGNLNNERYTFSGGCATRIGRITIGELIYFRAEHEYRTKDPRPRSIVTDLSMRVGVSYDFGMYILGTGLGARFYKQTNSVEFLKEDGVIPEYQMLGLGMYHKRFSGNNASSYYKGTGVSYDINISPTKKNGMYLSAEYNYIPYKRILPDINSLPLTTLYLYNYGCELGWKTVKRFGWSCFGGINYEKRDGDEHIAGNSSSGEYLIIADMTMFHSHKTDSYIGGALNFNGRSQWNLTGRIGYIDCASNYIFPISKMSFSKLYERIEGQLIRNIKNDITLNCRLSASYFHNLKKDITMPYTAMDNANTNLMQYTYSNITDNYLIISANVRADYTPANWKSYGMFIELGGGRFEGNNNNGNKIYLSTGITF